MAEAFPDQVPPALTEDSALNSSAHEADTQIREMAHPSCALLEPDEFHQYVSEASGLEVPPNFKISEESSRKGLNYGMEETEQSLHDKVSHLAKENQCLQIKLLAESDRVGKAESEVQNLKKALAALQAEKEAVLLQYQQSLQKLSDLEEELNHCAQKEDSSGLNEQARTAETEIQTLKQKLVKLEAERDAGFLQHKEHLQRISDLEFTISQTQEGAKGLTGRVAEAEIETQHLNKDLSSLQTESEAGLLHYKQYMEKICDLVNKLSLAEEEAKLLNKRADRAETEVKKLEKAIAKLNGEKETVVLQYEDCLGKISKLENELSCAQKDVARLNGEIQIGAAKQKGAEEKHVMLEMSNKSLRLEAENLSKKVAMKDQELSAKREELEKLKIHVRSEHLCLVRVEATLQTLQNLYDQSQEEQQALLELKNGLQMLKDLEICKQTLEEEIQRVWDENQNLNEQNLSSSIAMKNLHNEMLSLRNLKERLEEEVASQMSQNNAFQQEIYHLKQEIMGLRRRYRALMEQVESVGLNPDCIGLLVKDLQDENSKLKMICQEDREEKEALLKKLANMAEVLKKNATLESSLSDVNDALEASQENIKALQESCHFLQGERSTIVAEKSALLDQFQIVNENVQELLEKNTRLGNSLSGANAEIEDLRTKSKSLEELCKLLNNENSNQFSERSTLVVQLENLERRLENLEKMFSELEVKYASLEKERESTHSQVVELRVSLDLEKQEWTTCAMLNEGRLTCLEKSIHLLQEQSGWRKKEFEEELDKVMNSQFEIFILKNFMQDMEEKTHSLLIECQKHVEASKLAEEVIFKLKSENIERRDEIGRLRLGIYTVFKALEIGTDKMCEGEIQDEQIPIHHVLGNIEDMKCSLSQLKDDEQRLWVENSILLTFIKHMRGEGSEIELKKKMLEQKFDIVTAQLVMVQNEKHELIQMNRQLKSKLRKGDQQYNKVKAEMESLSVKHEDLQRAYFELQEEYCETLEENRSLVKKFSAMEEEKCMVEEENDFALGETLALCNLSLVFESFVIEKSIELKAITEELHNLNAINGDLENEINILREKLEMKEIENLLLNDSVRQLDKGLHEVRDINDQLSEENVTVKDFLRQKEEELSEAKQMPRATENLNSELCTTVEGLKRKSEESKLMRENLAKDTVELSEENEVQNKEVECLHELNKNLESELSILRVEIEEHRIKEEKSSLKLQERCNELELWEAEAGTFYFDLQVSSIREVMFENKAHELKGICQSLEDENASKTVEIKQMKERLGLMEVEIGGLKAQLFAYVPCMVSLREKIASLQQNALFLTKLSTAENQEPKVVGSGAHLHGKNSEEPMEEQISTVTDKTLDLRELQARINAVEEVVMGEIKRLSQESLMTNIKLESTMKEIEELNSTCSAGEKDKWKETKVQSKPETSETRNAVLMKDIPLDHVSEGSLYGVSRKGNEIASDQMLRLWETAEGSGPNKKINESEKQAYKANNGDPSSELQVEKELGVDKVEESTRVAEPNQERSNKKLLESLASNVQKLSSLQTTVQELRRKLEANKGSKKAKNVDFKMLKEQLEKIDMTVVQLLNMNDQLMKNTDGNSPLGSDKKAFAELEEAEKIEKRGVSEEAQNGSERIEKLQLEVQKIQHLLVEVEDEKKSKRRNRFSGNTISTILSNFIQSGRRSRETSKKTCICGCFRPSTNEDGNYI